MGNNHLCNVTGVGSMRLCFNDGSTFVTKNVRYVKALKNFISLDTFDNIGYIFKGEHGKLKVWRGFWYTSKV